MTTDNRFEIAHLARVELFSPMPQETVEFFTKFLGMYVTHREGQSSFLRAYEDPYQWSLKVTESPEAGIRELALRTTSVAALDRRAKALADVNIETNWHEDEYGYGKTLSFRDPDGHRVSILWEAEKYQAPPELASKILTRPSKKPLQGIPVKRLDHVNLLTADVAGTRSLYQNHLGYRRTEGVADGQMELAAWLSTNQQSHEIGLTRDGSGANGRLHHVAFFYGNQQALSDAAEMFRDYDIDVEFGPDVHGISQAAFLYVIEPGGNRIEMFGNAGVQYFDPDPEERVWDIPAYLSAGIAFGAAVAPQRFFDYGTPNLSPEALADLQAVAAAKGPVSSPS